MKKIPLFLIAVAITIFVGFLINPSSATAAYPPSKDPMRVKQTYLDQIQMNAAWAAAPAADSTIVVAVVDTGIDLTHPDLVNKLVKGTNLIQPGTEPMDDNGHGTNVAGIIAASVNNDKGIAGIAPNARIMPIKALEADGTGGEAKLSEGIRYAVDHGAKIVVLSLGLNKYSDSLSESVQYAEDHQVLLVAAVGNEGTSVKYPAAYPTVLAVGGSTVDKHADFRSNYGPELDLVAPWEVFTTALGGGYEYMDGSSMSAPQVAATAALACGKYPGMTAWQIRSLILQTAEDLDAPGWDETTGYGLLRADLALSRPYLEDPFEPNNSREQAKTLPVDALVHAQFSAAQDREWFALENPYDGIVDLEIRSADGSEITVRTGGEANGTGELYSTSGSNPISLQVKKGKTYIMLQTADRLRKTPLSYSLQTVFHIYRDPFEDNDKQYMAFVLPERSQTIRGTLHQEEDQDWFLLSLQHSGMLRLKSSVDTARIDPVVLFQKKGQKAIIIDQSGDGGTEVSSLMDVLPGEYYIRISNVKEYSEPIMGEYSLSIDFTPKLLDPNEPNDKSYQAAFASMSSSYEGVFNTSGDVDWFEFRLNEESVAQFSFTDIPDNRTLSIHIYNSSMNEKAFYTNDSGQNALYAEQSLPAGTYFIKLQSDQAFVNQFYHLQVESAPLISGYIDINGHWAAGSITELTGKEILTGYGNYRFAPDRLITRAEAAAALVRAFNLTKQKQLSYSDVGTNHWFYSYIAKAEQNGLVEGYPNNTFAPNRALTRMEMTNMLARSMKMAGKFRGNSPFKDVSEDYWGVGILKQMWADGWVSGYPDETFKPDQQATRAEFVTLLAKVLNR